MDFHALNQLLAQGIIDAPGQFPHLEELQNLTYRFQVDFGLKELPLAAGILLIRGARQYGKSTWLEGEIKKTIQNFGPGTAYYLNGEYLSDADKLEHEIKLLLPLFAEKKAVKRLFIDEITILPRWEIILKRLADQGLLKDILVITTGSKATDLRRAHERLPGRRGKLARSTYLFTPLSFAEFQRVCGKALGKKTLIAYLLSGGSPIACGALATEGIIPEYIIELTRDWIEGEFSASGRSRSALFNVLHTLFRFGGTPVGQAKLAREAGLANNTLAAGYIDLLNDLGCVTPTYPWDEDRKILILRKPCKYHFTNLLAAIAYHPSRIRSIKDFLDLPQGDQGVFYEWLVAQELIRRASLNNADILPPLAFWQSKTHEIDFVTADHKWLEVKKGQSSPVEFAWFTHTFPKRQLAVISSSFFNTSSIRGISLEDFLLTH